VDTLERKWLCPSQGSIPTFVRRAWGKLWRFYVRLAGVRAGIQSTFYFFCSLYVCCAIVLYLCICSPKHSCWLRNGPCAAITASQYTELNCNEYRYIREKIVSSSVIQQFWRYSCCSLHEVIPSYYFFSRLIFF